MRPIFARRQFYRARAKTRRPRKNQTDWLGAALLFLGALSFYCVLFPQHAGLWGQHLAQFLDWFAGTGRFLLPLLVSLLGVRILVARGRPWGAARITLIGGFYGVFLVLLTLLGSAVWGVNYGGILGLLGEQFFTRLFGQVGSWLVTLGILCTLGILMAGASPADVLARGWGVLRDDWKAWRGGRRTAPRSPRNPVVPPSPALLPVVQPKIMGVPAPETSLQNNSRATERERPPGAAAPAPTVTKAPLPAPMPPPQSGPDRSNGQPESYGSGQKGPSATAETSPAESPPAPKIPFFSPPLDIFDPIDRSKPVSRDELTGRARLLEQTLANFNIAATVVEIHPGPVITRYDLEPAPGVKVASITSRADDLALAMRSIGIRVIAPIPGKGAVGIEIPNSVAEQVGLRELLAIPQYVNHKSPLAIVLGKTVSGEPYVIDLAALPHLLVAGSTGSGKSVCIHTLLCSILYRVPPERVKFVLIDPKRLELPSYARIPHLYDPCHNPTLAEVITNPKQAAKALLRLVKVMEYRYDQFAKANVRNIESFNEKRIAAGEPPEHYLVVIIDELADLMLTLPKDVEDAIQRLAQMARAVGIHLVLATQRPSVDVITGVIKANLPARIALRVASSTDSRVIIDTVGADMLLGKGDMLYLPPASPDPIRVQGAFVSEKEVEKLVNHTVQFGMPQYQDLFGMGSALEFAVEDKKEMKDLIEALRLILERRRVSQDLLKAHFGSSARATNILSLLEVRQFINKPEGSNRWEINFDLIEEFLSHVANFPEQEIAV